MTENKLPTWFWVIATAALVWNILGVGAYLGHVTLDEAGLAAMTEAERELRVATPGWVTGAYAIAVFGGVAAAIMLMMRRNIAIPLFTISLAAVIIQMGYVFIGMGAATVLGASAMIFPAVIIVLGAMQLWFATLVKNRGWSR